MREGVKIYFYDTQKYTILKYWNIENVDFNKNTFFRRTEAERRFWFSPVYTKDV